MQPAARRLLFRHKFDKAVELPAKHVRLVDKCCESLWKVHVLSLAVACSGLLKTDCILCVFPECCLRKMEHADRFLCAMQLVVYTVLLLVGLYALYDQPYLTDSSFFWRGWPTHNIP